MLSAEVACRSHGAAPCRSSVAGAVGSNISHHQPIRREDSWNPCCWTLLDAAGHRRRRAAVAGSVQHRFHVLSSLGRLSGTCRSSLSTPGASASGQNNRSGVFSYYNKYVEIHDSARRHGVADQDIVNAIDHGSRSKTPEKTPTVGCSSARTPLATCSRWSC